jgi:hypothetical protein
MSRRAFPEQIMSLLVSTMRRRHSLHSVLMGTIVRSRCPSSSKNASWAQVLRPLDSIWSANPGTGKGCWVAFCLAIMSAQSRPSRSLLRGVTEEAERGYL